MLSIAPTTLSFGSKSDFELIIYQLDLSYDTFYGIVGRNGVGKTTFMKLISGLHSNSKSVTWSSDAMFYKYYLPSGGKLKDNLTVKEQCRFAYFGSVPFEMRLSFLQGILNLQFSIDSCPTRLSFGQNQLSRLLVCLINLPKVLILDEPTTGMDIVAKGQFSLALKALKKELKISAFIASHDLHVIKELCDSVLVINQSKIKVFDSVNEWGGKV
jgi:ABC-2 type transport system ATP-binding protein